jgi:predicted RNase H-like HicB family nuclease
MKTGHPTKHPVLSFTCVYVQDPESMGFSAYFEEFPDTFAQGLTKDEALNNLWKTLGAVFSSYSKKAKGTEKKNVTKEEVSLTYA